MRGCCSLYYIVFFMREVVVRRGKVYVFCILEDFFFVRVYVLRRSKIRMVLGFTLLIAVGG